MTIPTSGDLRPGWLIRSPLGVLFLAPGNDPSRHPAASLLHQSESEWGLVGRVLSGLSETGAEGWGPFILLVATEPVTTMVRFGQVAVSVDGVPTTSRAGEEGGPAWKVTHPPGEAVIEIAARPFAWMVASGTGLEAGTVPASGALALPAGNRPAFAPSDEDAVTTVLPNLGRPQHPDAGLDANLDATLDADRNASLDADRNPNRNANFDADRNPNLDADRNPNLDADRNPNRRPNADRAPDFPYADLSGPTGQPTPVGVLVWDSGRVEPLSRDLILGRQPWDHPRVAAGTATGAIPEGTVTGLSDTHAELQIDGDTVTLIDRGSVNGTFVWEADGGRWRRLAPGEGQILTLGTTFALAERTVTLEPVPQTGPDDRITNNGGGADATDVLWTSEPPSEQLRSPAG